MVIELLYFDGCPNHERLLQRLPELFARAAVTEPISLVEVSDEQAAQRERFLGSPSLRIDGQDVEPGSEARDDYGLKCRMYRTSDGLSGMPSDVMVLAALRPVSPTH